VDKPNELKLGRGYPINSKNTNIVEVQTGDNATTFSYYHSLKMMSLSSVNPEYLCGCSRQGS
jgi:hypothetical protein